MARKPKQTEATEAKPELSTEHKVDILWKLANRYHHSEIRKMLAEK